MTRLIPIESPDDPRLAMFRRNDRGLANRIQRRDDAGDGLFLAEGDLVVERALEAGYQPVAALADAARQPAVTRQLLAGTPGTAEGIDVHIGGVEIRRLVTGLGLPQSVIALFKRPPRRGAPDLANASDRLVILEGVDNPANVGSIVRNAAALGWNGLLLDHTSADPLARRALRVAMGTAFALPHARTSDLVSVVGNLASMTVIALTLDDDAVDLESVRVSGPRAVMIGSERAGLSADLAAVANLRVRIPMAGGVDSLNAAAASAIACFALRR
jgi:tRNA G18 (ribose-2'-O)-methylase SpoU